MLTASGPRLHLSDGTTDAPRLLVGADGLHSVLRGALNGPAAPFFTGQAAWRAIVPAEPGAPAVAEIHMGAGRHLVSYPLRGGTLRNIVAVEERRRWVQESWSLADDPLALRLAFAGFSPRVRGWLDAVTDCWLWGLFRHPVARRWTWTSGNGWGHGAAILGDAAHPTLPFLAQGGNLALEDAWSLAERLAHAASLAEGLAAWQAARLPRVTRAVEAAGRAARLYHLSGPAATIARAGMQGLGRLAPGLMLGRYDWLHGFDVTRA
jgi:salicylate hydroxylase